MYENKQQGFLLLDCARFFSDLVLPAIGQTIELLTVNAPAELPTTTTTTAAAINQPSAEILLQELTTLIQQPPADIVPLNIGQKLAGPTSRTGNTAVKSTITSNNNATIRKPMQQQMTNDERMFFGRPTTIGQGQPISWFQ